MKILEEKCLYTRHIFQSISVKFLYVYTQYCIPIQKLKIKVLNMYKERDAFSVDTPICVQNSKTEFR